MSGTLCSKTERNTHARCSEFSDGARGIVDTGTPRMTAQTFVNELVSVLYPCHSDRQLCRPKSVVEMVTITIDLIRKNHSSTDSILKMLFHLGYLTEHGTYQGIVIM